MVVVEKLEVLLATQRVGDANGGHGRLELVQVQLNVALRMEGKRGARAYERAVANAYVGASMRKTWKRKRTR